MMKDNVSKGPTSSKPDKVRHHVRALLVKLTEHVKQKSVDGSSSIKANREQHSSECVEYA